MKKLIPKVPAMSDNSKILKYFSLMTLNFFAGASS